MSAPGTVAGSEKNRPTEGSTTTAAPARTDGHSRLGSKQHSDGGWGLVPVQVRDQRFSSYQVTDFEPVTGLEAEWKRTPLKAIAALVGDPIDGAALDIRYSQVPGVTVETVDRSDSRVGSAGTPEDRASANAWTCIQQAVVITVAAEDAAELVIERRPGAAPRAAHTVIIGKRHSKGTVVLQGNGPALFSENVEIVLEDGAQLTVVTVQEWDDDAVHLASHFAEIGRDARLTHVVVSLGGKVVRVNPSTHLAGEGGEVALYGVYFADAGQHLEQQVFVNHDAPKTVSRVSYKGALQGEGAHTVWIGDVLIRQSGSGTDSYEQNRNLLLTDGTRADSIPNLEIETGDIAWAGHASASGRFDDEQLFYLQARGIAEDEARRLVVLGFLVEIIQQIGSPGLEERLVSAIEAELRSELVA
ncbi:Fe-S cluster assembly protein SufD [soil metagenome]